MSSEVTWKPCEVAVKVLKDAKIPYKIQTISLSKIDWGTSKTNIGRTGRGVEKQLFEQYALAMLDGDPFPMPILAKFKGKLLVAAGMHRCMAVQELEQETLEAYVIELTYDHDLRLISLETNTLMGKRSSLTERLMQGVHLVVVYGLSREEVTRRLRLKPSTLANRIRAQECKTRAAGLGFSGVLVDTVWTVLSTVHNDNVLKILAPCVRKYNLGTEATRELCSAICKKGTEASQIALLEDRIKSLEVSNKPATIDGKPAKSSVSLPVRTRFIKLFHGLGNLVERYPTLNKLQIEEATDEYKQFKQEWGVLRKRLNAVFTPQKKRHSHRS